MTRRGIWGMKVVEKRRASRQLVMVNSMSGTRWHSSRGYCERKGRWRAAELSVSRAIAGSRQLRRRSEKVFDTQTDSAVKFTYTINERRVYLL